MKLDEICIESGELLFGRKIHFSNYPSLNEEIISQSTIKKHIKTFINTLYRFIFKKDFLSDEVNLEKYVKEKGTPLLSFPDNSQQQSIEGDNKDVSLDTYFLGNNRSKNGKKVGILQQGENSVVFTFNEDAMTNLLDYLNFFPEKISGFLHQNTGEEFVLRDQDSYHLYNNYVLFAEHLFRNVGSVIGGFVKRIGKSNENGLEGVCDQLETKLGGFETSLQELKNITYPELLDFNKDFADRLEGDVQKISGLLNPILKNSSKYADILKTSKERLKEYANFFKSLNEDYSLRSALYEILKKPHYICQAESLFHMDAENRKNTLETFEHMPELVEFFGFIKEVKIRDNGQPPAEYPSAISYSDGVLEINKDTNNISYYRNGKVAEITMWEKDSVKTFFYLDNILVNYFAKELAKNKQNYTHLEKDIAYQGTDLSIGSEDEDYCVFIELNKLNSEKYAISYFKKNIGKRSILFDSEKKAKNGFETLGRYFEKAYLKEHKLEKDNRGMPMTFFDPALELKNLRVIKEDGVQKILAAYKNKDGKDHEIVLNLNGSLGKELVPNQPVTSRFTPFYKQMQHIS